MSVNTLTSGAFQDAAGNVLSNGYLVFELSHDELDTTTGAQICAGLLRTATLDNTGSIAGTFTIENNDTMTPAGSFYTVMAHRSDGVKAWRSVQYVQVVSTSSPFNLSTGLTPSQPS